MNKRSIESQRTAAVLKQPKGFTLLELLVVIIIVSILFTYAALTIRGNSPEELIMEEASRLNRLLQLALEEAVLKNTEYGIEFNSRGYRFMYFDDEKWHAMEMDRLLRERELPHEMQIELIIEQQDVATGEDADSEIDKDPTPQVLLLSSEEISPEFSARFTIPGIAASYLVHGAIDGQHTVKASEL